VLLLANLRRRALDCGVPVGEHNLKDWLTARYAINQSNAGDPTYNAFDLIRLFDAGKISLATEIVRLDEQQAPLDFGNTDIYFNIDELRLMASPELSGLLLFSKLDAHRADFEAQAKLQAEALQSINMRLSRLAFGITGLFVILYMILSFQR
jgi:hypothetical protein